MACTIATGRAIAVARTVVQPSTAGVFNGTTQYESVASSSTLQPSDNCWYSAFVKLTTTSGNQAVITKWNNTGNQRQMQLSYTSSRWIFGVSSNGITAVSAVANTFGLPVVGVWYRVFGWLDTVAGVAGIIVNNVSETIAASGMFTTGTAAVMIGARADPVNYLSGSIAAVVFGKNPVGGFATTPAATIAAALYASGNGLRPSQITAAQRTAWGVVSGWLDNGSLTADQIGNNTLTNNNGVTLSTTSGPWGTTRTIATARVPYVCPVFVSANIDATGLLLSVVWDRAVSHGTPVPTFTADGVAGTLAYASGDASSTLVYAITNGNPSGNPVVAGAVVVAAITAGMATVSGVANQPTQSGVSVTNGSAIIQDPVRRYLMGDVPPGLFPHQLSGQADIFALPIITSLGTVFN